MAFFFNRLENTYRLNVHRRSLTKHVNHNPSIHLELPTYAP